MSVLATELNRRAAPPAGFEVANNRIPFTPPKHAKGKGKWKGPYSSGEWQYAPVYAVRRGKGADSWSRIEYFTWDKREN